MGQGTKITQAIVQPKKTTYTFWLMFSPDDRDVHIFLARQTQSASEILGIIYHTSVKISVHSGK